MKRTRTLAILAIATLGLAGCMDTGSGDKVGMITKVAKKGIFCQTWDIQIQRGGFNAGTGVNGAAFDLTIENNEALVKKAQELMNRNADVKVTYRTEFATLCRDNAHNNAFVTNIEELTPAVPATTADGVMDSDHGTSAGDADWRARSQDAEARALRLRAALEPLIRELSTQ